MEEQMLRARLLQQVQFLGGLKGVGLWVHGLGLGFRVKRGLEDIEMLVPLPLGGMAVCGNVRPGGLNL